MKVVIHAIMTMIIGANLQQHKVFWMDNSKYAFYHPIPFYLWDLGIEKLKMKVFF